MAGTQIVPDSWGGYSQGTIALGDVALFGNKYGTELWKSDGTESGTTPFVTLPDQTVLTGISPVSSDRFFYSTFNSRGGESAANTLWISDGSVTGTKDLRTFNGPNSFISQMTVVDGKLFFTTSDGDSGNELWISDGTPLGTHLLKDVNPGIASSYPVGLTVAGECLFLYCGKSRWVSRSVGNSRN